MRIHYRIGGAVLTGSDVQHLFRATVAIALIAVALAGCTRSDPKAASAAEVAAANARVAALEARVSALEAAQKAADRTASEIAKPAAAKAELRVLDGFNSPPHTYPTIEACMQAKARIEAQFAEREAEARSRGELLNAGAASCLPLLLLRPGGISGFGSSSWGWFWRNAAASVVHGGVAFPFVAPGADKPLHFILPPPRRQPFCSLQASLD